MRVRGLRPGARLQASRRTFPTWRAKTRAADRGRGAPVCAKVEQLGRIRLGDGEAANRERASAKARKTSCFGSIVLASRPSETRAHERVAEPGSWSLRSNSSFSWRLSTRSAVATKSRRLTSASEPPPPIEEQIEMTIYGVEAETTDGTRERIERPTHVEWRHHDEDSHHRREAQHARSTARTLRSVSDETSSPNSRRARRARRARSEH